MRALSALLVVGMLAACGGDDDGDAAPPTTDPVTTTDDADTTTSAPETTTTTATARPLPVGELETVATGLEVPWALAWVDSTTILVTERPGRVRVVEDGVLRPEPVLTVDAVDQGEGGLLGVALHPGFPDERAVFVYYTASGGNRVSRFEVGDDLALTGETPILDAIPSAQFHDGGRIAFGPDDLLYVTTGDARDPSLAADTGSLAGKILRVRPDGSIPDDNPFDGSPVYSYGHRNPQGLAWDEDGRLYASEHGPTGDLGLCCHDEVNLIEPGGFYGWPYRAGEIDAAAGDPPADPIPPLASSGEGTWAPAGLAVVETDTGSALVLATLAGRQLLRLDLDDSDPPAVTQTDVAVDGLGRLRLAAIGPDGCLYLGTSNTDGRGNPGPDDDRIQRSC